MTPPRKKAKKQPLSDAIYSEKDWAKITKGQHPPCPDPAAEGVVSLHI